MNAVSMMFHDYYYVSRFLLDVGFPQLGIEAWLQIHLLAPVAGSRAGGHLDLRGGLQVLAVMAATPRYAI